MNSERLAKQAVILAGGEGRRLRPLTEKLPKPMIPFHGKPFLEYLLEDLKEKGFEKILLLLGYLPEVIVRHFGDGSDFGLEIEYSISAVENESGLRLKLASIEGKLEDLFLLMYCDNICPLQIDKMEQQFVETGADVQFVVYTNKDNHTRDNVCVGENHLVAIYDKSRTQTGLRGVDIGFMLVKKKALSYLPEENSCFEKIVLPELVRQKKLAAFETDHRYYSVGSLDRLESTGKFLERKPTVLLDRDGVLNKKAPEGDYVCNASQFEWLPGSKEGVALLNEKGYRVLLASNQAGIARGRMTVEDFREIHRKIDADLSAIGGSIEKVYFCPHGWDENCECRKPKPGMLFQAQKDFHLDLSRTCFIGDDVRDIQAGEAAGCPTLQVSSEYPLLRYVQERF